MEIIDQVILWLFTFNHTVLEQQPRQQFCHLILVGMFLVSVELLHIKLEERITRKEMKDIPTRYARTTRYRILTQPVPFAG